MNYEYYECPIKEKVHNAPQELNKRQWIRFNKNSHVENAHFPGVKPSKVKSSWPQRKTTPDKVKFTVVRG